MVSRFKRKVEVACQVWTCTFCETLDPAPEQRNETLQRRELGGPLLMSRNRDTREPSLIGQHNTEAKAYQEVSVRERVN